jgi:hypothetical protein
VFFDFKQDNINAYNKEIVKILTDPTGPRLPKVIAELILKYSNYNPFPCIVMPK